MKPFLFFAGVLMALLVGAIAGSGAVHAQVPDRISYQGVLMTGTAPVDSVLTIVIRLYDVPSGGGPLYQETDAAVAVEDGVFSMTLGDNPTGGFPHASLSSALNAAATLYLEVTALGSTFLPRERLLSAPYSIRTRGIFVTAADSVGIGTTSPQARLDVAGNIRTSGTYRYNSPRTYVKHFPAAAFSEDAGGGSLSPYFNRLHDYIALYATPGPLSKAFSAPLDLPHGARLTQCVVYGYDNHASLNMQILMGIARRPIASTTPEGVVSAYFLTTGGAGTGILSEARTSFISPVIDKQNYSYYVSISMAVDGVSQDLRFYGARVVYELDHVEP